MSQKKRGKHAKKKTRSHKKKRAEKRHRHKSRRPSLARKIPVRRLRRLEHMSVKELVEGLRHKNKEAREIAHYLLGVYTRVYGEKRVKLDERRRAREAPSIRAWITEPYRYDIPGIDAPLRHGSARKKKHGITRRAKKKIEHVLKHIPLVAYSHRRRKRERITTDEYHRYWERLPRHVRRSISYVEFREKLRKLREKGYDLEAFDWEHEELDTLFGRAGLEQKRYDWEEAPIEMFEDAGERLFSARIEHEPYPAELWEMTHMDEAYGWL